MVAENGVEHRLALAELLGEVVADLGVGALLLVVHGLADVVEEAAAAGEGAVEAELVGDDLTKEGDLDRVAEHVLAVAGAVGELAHRLRHLAVDVAEVDFQHRVLAGLDDFLVDLRAHLLHHLLDARGVHAAVGDQPLERLDGHGLADLVEARDDDHAGGVINDDVHAGGLLDGADVATLAPDDAALHVVGGNGHGADGALAGVFGGAALDGHERDLAGLLLGLALRVVGDLAGDFGHVLAALVLHALQQQFACRVHAHARDRQQAVALLHQYGLQFHLLGGGLGLALLQRLDLLADLVFLLGEAFELLVEQVLALGDAPLGLANLVAGRFGLLLELLLAFLDAFICVQFRTLHGRAGILLGAAREPRGIAPGPRQHTTRLALEDRHADGQAHHHAGDQRTARPEQCLGRDGGKGQRSMSEDGRKNLQEHRRAPMRSGPASPGPVLYRGAAHARRALPVVREAVQIARPAKVFLLVEHPPHVPEVPNAPLAREPMPDSSQWVRYGFNGRTLWDGKGRANLCAEPRCARRTRSPGPRLRAR